MGKPDVLVVSPPQDLSRPVNTVASSVAVDPLVGELPMPEEVLERYLEIRDVETHEAITVMEILSPTNKTTRDGRAQYERKRLKVLSGLTNLVEIDLLRVGKPFAMKVPQESAYRIVVSHSEHRPRADFYLFDLQEPIPDFPIPLRPGETEPTLPLNQILHTLYDEGGYDLAIDYRRPPIPPFSDEDAAWAEDMLMQK